MSSSVAERVHQLSPVIDRRADEIEKLHAIPSDIMAELTEAGCFRMLVPRSYGGEELTLAESLSIIEELAASDASTGWSVMIACSNLMVLALLPRATFDSIYRNGPDVICGGSHAPKGDAIPTRDGYIVSGQWPFASGCQHSDLLAVHAAVHQNGRRQLMQNGMPVMRLAVFPSAELEVVDTWDTLGLRGTASHDIRADQVYCPEEWTCQLFGAVPTIEGPVFSLPPIAPLALFIASVAIGIASGVLQDLVAVAEGGKRPAYGSQPVAKSALFQTGLGELDASLRAARALVLDEARRAWQQALSGKSFSLLDRARMRSASSFAVPAALKVAHGAFRLAGSSALHSDSPMQRRLRDIQTLAQHTGVGPEFFTIAGAILAGEETDTMRI